MNNYIVYKHIFPNNKIYIGITRQNPYRRWRNGKGYSCQVLVYNAINKYGWEKIEHKILFTELSLKEAEDIEMYLISKYKSNQIEYGYNIANGGNCIETFSEETKKKISNSHKGIKFSQERKNNIQKALLGKKRNEETKMKIGKLSKGNKYRLGAILTKETKDKISKSNIEWHKHNKSNNVGRKHTEEAKEKIRQTRLGKSFKDISIIQYDLQNNKIQIYNSILKASQELKINKGNICGCCKGKLNTAGGYIWKYAY